MSERIVGKVIKMFGSGQKPNNWFAGVLRLDNGSSVKIAGTANTRINVGTRVEFEGTRINDKYGEQYVPVKGMLISRVFSGQRELVQYLSSDLFPGVGIQTATKLYECYGDQILEMLRNNIDVVAKKCGLKTSQVTVLSEGIRMESGVVDLMKAFPHMRATTAQRILEKSGKEPVQFIIRYIQSKPYEMMCSVYHLSFKDADTIAVADLGVDVLNLSRIEMMIYLALSSYMHERHATYVRLSNAKEFRDFFWNYFLKVSVYVELPEYWDNQYFNEDCLANHIANWPSGGNHLFTVTDARLDEFGNIEYGLYHTDMWLAEQRLSRVIGESYFADSKKFEKRYKAFGVYVRECMQNNEPMNVSSEQLAAVSSVYQHSVSFITGGPGRGKTACLRFLIQTWKKIVSSNVLLLAPTGKAVNRLKTQTDYYNAETVMRFLVSNKKNKTPVDAFFSSLPQLASTLVVIDEASMLSFVDVNQLWDLIQNCTVVFVGDKDQLPPIEPGPFLQECLKSQNVFKHWLTHNFRTESTEIGDNADKILRGCKVKDLQLTDNFQFWSCDETKTDESVLSQAESFILDRYLNHIRDGCEFSDILVIAPFASAKYPLSSFNLNKMLQDKVNPAVSNPMYNVMTDDYGRFYEGKGKASGVLDSDGLEIRIGDRLMNIKNDMDLEWHVFRNDHCYFDDDLIDPSDGSNFGLFNGDVGTVERVYSGTAKHGVAIMVKLDDLRSEMERQLNPQPNRYVWLESELNHQNKSVLKNWSLGYALSVHKSQGSEAEHVIIALSEQGYKATQYRVWHGGMPFLTRNMLYTAITRAKKSVMIVGSADAFESCLEHEYEYTNVRLSKGIDSIVG